MRFFTRALFNFICFSQVFSALAALQPIIPCLSNREDTRHGYVAAAMIFQNEARYLKEWIEYHKALGIKHFYLYNNASGDHYWSILEPYVLNGDVELFDMPIRKTDAQEFFAEQRGAYDHAVNLSQGRHVWLAIIDSDEFICIPDKNNINEFLSHYLYAPALAINWAMYGSSDIYELGPEELQIEKLTHRAHADWGENFLVKSIVRPEYVASADIHTCVLANGLSAIFANHQQFSHHPVFALPPIDIIRINHYWWRDEKYFYEVKMPRRISWLTRFSEEEIQARRQAYNAVEDHSISHMVSQTRQGVFGE